MEVCRTCLTVAVEKDIRQLPKDLEGENQNYSDIILFCLSIHIHPGSKITLKLCMTCYLNILSFHKFKTLALKNDKYLRSLKKEDKVDYLLNDIKNEEIIDFNDNEDDIHSDTDLKNFHVKEENNLEELQSDDELLSVLKKIKYENETEDSQDSKKFKYVENASEESKENTNNFKYCENATEENQANDSSTPVKRKKLKKVKCKKEEKQNQICEECGKVVRDLKAHLFQHKPLVVRRRYKCKSCDKMFSSPSARLKHYKIKHLGIKKHCDICNKDVVSLSTHRMVVHDTASLPFECIPCGRRFASRSLRDQHLLIHTKNRPYHCNQCEKSYISKMTLLQHKRQVHDKEKSHLCQFCSKSFFKKYHLLIHIRSHSKEKPYECPECGKFFSSTSSLKNHRLIHSEVKNFACNYCEMTFSKPAYLKNHMVCHTKEKRYSCKYCDVRFGRSDHRLRHERTAHERRFLPAA